MSKKMKIVVAIITGVVLLGIIGTAAVMADTPPNSTTPPAVTRPARPDVYAIVAPKLGVTEAQLTAAIKQARTALAPTVTPNVLANPGVTPANPSARPMHPAPIKSADLYDKVASILNGQTPSPNLTGDQITAAFQQAEKGVRDQAINTALDNARTSGKITQADETQIQQWLQNRPAALDKLGMGIPFGMGPMGRNFHGANNFAGKPKGSPTPSPTK